LISRTRTDGYTKQELQMHVTAAVTSPLQAGTCPNDVLGNFLGRRTSGAQRNAQWRMRFDSSGFVLVASSDKIVLNRMVTASKDGSEKLRVLHAARPSPASALV
jgi:hypothetical protein